MIVFTIITIFDISICNYIDIQMFIYFLLILVNNIVDNMVIIVFGNINIYN